MTVTSTLAQHFRSEHQALKVLNTSVMTLPYTDNHRMKFVSRFCEYQPCAKWQMAKTDVGLIGLGMQHYEVKKTITTV